MQQFETTIAWCCLFERHLTLNVGCFVKQGIKSLVFLSEIGRAINWTESAQYNSLIQSLFFERAINPSVKWVRSCMSISSIPLSQYHNSSIYSVTIITITDFKWYQFNISADFRIYFCGLDLNWPSNDVDNITTRTQGT